MRGTSLVVSRLLVASRLALRWAAQRRQNQTLRFTWQTLCVPMGLLRSPTQGKPAHHNRAAKLPHQGKQAVVSRLPVGNKLFLVNRLRVGNKPLVVSRPLVASRLALRWAAQRPQNQTLRFT
ncbi:hypothetical protein BBG20_21160 [Pseudomonas aylmerensis]|uniref:Secreted protein n=1 Tax=Pseudomonas aylmerensis TaxID=1869229 RepID=A0ABX2YRJ1_9PSED|nr:hypothetical protein BBG20_21160 [Pseudomonas aylmerensis]